MAITDGDLSVNASHSSHPSGRALDEEGETIPETGFEIGPESKIAEKLRERTGPLVSNPVSEEWVAELLPPEDTGGESHSTLI